MTYLPSDSINSNYRYSINNDYYLIRTNNNCYTQYSSTYCDCYYIYPKNDYIKSEVSSCNYNSGTWVNSSNFTSNFWYRLDMPNILLMFFILFIFGFYFPYRVIARLFGRWFKI